MELALIFFANKFEIQDAASPCYRSCDQANPNAIVTLATI
jgi:hypothetical protein